MNVILRKDNRISSLWMITFVKMVWEYSWQFGIFFTANIALLIAYLYHYLPPFFSAKVVYRPSEKTKVSILVCARNEYDNLKRNIPLWCGQQGVLIELIVVNDHSEDNTKLLLQEYSAKFEQLKWIDSDSPLTSKLGKKHALIQAVRAASGSVLLFTDADCTPASKMWASTMAGGFCDEKVGVILGYSPVEEGSNGILSQLQYFDSVITALQYFSALRKGRPYMAVGRNTAYRVEAYPMGELVRQMNYSSGDDDLVFQSLDAKWHIQGELDPKAFVFARGKSSWKTWFGQKRRHFNVVDGYSPEKSRIPASFRLLQIFWIGAAFGIMATANYSYILLSLLPIGGFAFVLYKWRNALRLQNPIVGVFLEPLRYLVVVSVTISLLIKRPKKW